MKIYTFFFFFLLLESSYNKGKAELILITERQAVSLPVILLLQKSLCIKIPFPKVNISTAI